VIVCDLLKLISSHQQGVFCKRSTNDLESNGQSLLVKSAWHCQRRQTQERDRSCELRDTANQGQNLFTRGLDLYHQRPDKQWSLTDCISFVVMRDRGMSEALTGDRHFEQAGFRPLLA